MRGLPVLDGISYCSKEFGKNCSQSLFENIWSDDVLPAQFGECRLQEEEVRGGCCVAVLSLVQLLSIPVLWTSVYDVFYSSTSLVSWLQVGYKLCDAC